MKTFESIGKRDILKYLVQGYDLPYAIRQAKAIHRHGIDPAIDKAAESLSWWCELHQEAVEKMASKGSDWFRYRDISDRPEVYRDLSTVKVIESEWRPAENSQGKTGNDVAWFRKSLKYLEV